MYDVHAEMGWESLEICHVFTHSIVFKQPMACECHNYIIPNIKTYFDKKVALLVLVPVLQ